MNENYTQPTPHLRFAERPEMVTETTVRVVRILQQRWVGPGTYSDYTDALKWPGEWRDVPLEKQP